MCIPKSFVGLEMKNPSTGDHESSRWQYEKFIHLAHYKKSDDGPTWFSSRFWNLVKTMIIQTKMHIKSTLMDFCWYTIVYKPLNVYDLFICLHPTYFVWMHKNPQFPTPVTDPNFVFRPATSSLPIAHDQWPHCMKKTPPWNKQKKASARLRRAPQKGNETRKFGKKHTVSGAMNYEPLVSGRVYLVTIPLSYYIRTP